MSRKKSGFQITGVSSEAASPPGPGSRFRVVRLGVGTGEPYRRGRWTCRDCYEVPVPPVPSHPSLALRLPHSLDATRAHPGMPSAPQARSLGGPSAAALPSTTRLIQQQELPLSCPASPALPEGGPSQMVPDPLGLARSMLALDEDSSKQGAPLGPRSRRIQGWAMALDPQGVSVKAMVSSYEARGVPRGCGCCALPDTGNPRHRGCASPAPSRGSSPAHAPTMPALGALGSRPGGTDKALLSLLVCVHSAGSGVIAIDNKIEQAMDLVKSHLLLAVREEVELLREQIRELAERGVALERENALLRALATPAQLAQLRPPASPGGGE